MTTGEVFKIRLKCSKTDRQRIQRMAYGAFEFATSFYRDLYLENPVERGWDIRARKGAPDAKRAGRPPKEENKLTSEQIASIDKEVDRLYPMDPHPNSIELPKDVEDTLRSQVREDLVSNREAMNQGLISIGSYRLRGIPINISRLCPEGQEFSLECCGIKLTTDSIGTGGRNKRAMEKALCDKCGGAGCAECNGCGTAKSVRHARLEIKNGKIQLVLTLEAQGGGKKENENGVAGIYLGIAHAATVAVLDGNRLDDDYFDTRHFGPFEGIGKRLLSMRNTLKHSRGKHLPKPYSNLGEWQRAKLQSFVKTVAQQAVLYAWRRGVTVIVLGVKKGGEAPWDRQEMMRQITEFAQQYGICIAIGDVPDKTMCSRCGQEGESAIGETCKRCGREYSKRERSVYVCTICNRKTPKKENKETSAALSLARIAAGDAVETVTFQRLIPKA